MIVLSLFDGMSCGQIALRESGLQVTKYYASEVDKFAIHNTLYNFPDTVQLGDVRNIDATKLGHIDLLIGGSPCQCFSFAGKRTGMSTKANEKVVTLDRYLELKRQGFEFEGQSYLFWEYVRILNELRQTNPDIFFMLENVEMGKQWEQVINDAIGIVGVHINSALVSAQVRKRIYWTNVKTAQCDLFGPPHSAIPQPEDRKIFIKDIVDESVDEKYYLSDERVMGVLIHNKRQKEKGNGFRAVFHEMDGKAGTVAIGGKGIVDLIIQRCRGFNKGGIFVKKSPTLSANSWQQNNLLGGCRIRRLTPTECSRLQTIPEWYKWDVSEAQQYRMLGNGWTVEVIKHIFSFLQFEKD